MSSSSSSGWEKYIFKSCKKYQSINKREAKRVKPTKTSSPFDSFFGCWNIDPLTDLKVKKLKQKRERYYGLINASIIIFEYIGCLRLLVLIYK